MFISSSQGILNNFLYNINAPVDIDWRIRMEREMSKRHECQEMNNKLGAIQHSNCTNHRHRLLRAHYLIRNSLKIAHGLRVHTYTISFKQMHN